MLFALIKQVQAFASQQAPQPLCPTCGPGWRPSTQHAVSLQDAQWIRSQSRNLTASQDEQRKVYLPKWSKNDPKCLLCNFQKWKASKPAKLQTKKVFSSCLSMPWCELMWLSGQKTNRKTKCLLEIQQPVISWLLHHLHNLMTQGNQNKWNPSKRQSSSKLTVHVRTFSGMKRGPKTSLPSTVPRRLLRPCLYLVEPSCHSDANFGPAHGRW